MAAQIDMDILITEDLQSPAIDRLEKKYKITRDPALWKDAAKLKAAIGEARAVMVRNQTQVTAEVLDPRPNCSASGASA